MEQRRRQFIPGPGFLLLATILLGALGAVLHDFRGVIFGWGGAILWGGAVIITFVLGTAHLSRRLLPVEGNAGWTEGFRLLWRSYMLGVNSLLAGRYHEPMASPAKRKKAATPTRSPSFDLLGAGFLFSHEVAAITRGNSFVRAAGPGLVYLHQGEAIAQLFDLRTQSRRKEVEAITRDGILVKTSVSVSFHVRRLATDQRHRRSIESDPIPYPYDREALFDLNYANSVAGEERLGWAEQALPLAETLLVGQINRFTLDQLLLSGGKEPLGEIKTTILRGLEAMQKSETGPTLPKGLKIVSVGVGGLELPDDVVKKRIQSWQVEGQKLIDKAHADSALETQRRINQARAQALADNIEELLTSIETVQAHSHSQLHEVILSQLVETLESLATRQAMGTLPQQTQWLTLATDASHEMRRLLEQEE